MCNGRRVASGQCRDMEKALVPDQGAHSWLRKNMLDAQLGQPDNAIKPLVPDQSIKHPHGPSQQGHGRSPERQQD